MDYGDRRNATTLSTPHTMAAPIMIVQSGVLSGNIAAPIVASINKRDAAPSSPPIAFMTGHLYTLERFGPFY